jgi:hypothetical protein
MRFQVGMFLCEMSLDDHGDVRWFLRSGRKTEPPKYLHAADRRHIASAVTHSSGCRKAARAARTAGRQELGHPEG